MKSEAISIKGQQLARKLGFPTINLKTDTDPEEGVFQGQLIINKRTYDGAIFIGKSTTFNIDQKKIEIHLFDFDQEVPEDTKCTLVIKKKIREPQKFNSVNELKKQIAKDLQTIKKMLK